MQLQDLLPNLVVPGVAKSGTSSLFWYLSQHPDIFPANKKEINYFGSLRFGPEPKAPIEQYASHFSRHNGERYRLDASQVYFDGGAGVVDAIRTNFPEPKILVIVRDPITRLWSSFTSTKHLGELPPDMEFRSYFERCRALRASGKDMVRAGLPYRALSTSAYVDHAALWLDAFDDVRFIFFEHMVEDPVTLLTDVCRWLDVDPEPVRHFDFARRNRTLEPRSRTLYQLANAINLRIDRGSRLSGRTKERLRGLYRLVNTTKAEERMTEDDRARVEEYFAPLNGAFRAELVRRGYRRFPEWLNHIG